MVGDLNIAPLENDVWSHKQLLDVVSHTPIETEAPAAAAGDRRLGRCGAAFRAADEKLYQLVELSRAGLGGVGPRPPPRSCVGDAVGGGRSGKSAQILREARGWATPSDHVPVIVDFA